jgi:hypothetical protein
MIGLAALTVIGHGSVETAKKPKSFWEPGAKPRQGHAVVPRSSALTGRFSFPRNRKTAFRRLQTFCKVIVLLGEAATLALGLCSANTLALGLTTEFLPRLISEIGPERFSTRSALVL